MDLPWRRRRSLTWALPASLRRRVQYRRRFGHHLPLGRPRTFVDKVNWRILHDRRAVLEGTCDKLCMKEHARRVAPGLVRVPRTLWAGTDLDQLAGADLTERWVLKPNHSTGRVVLGEGAPDVAALAERTHGWLQEDLSRRDGEWAYRSARPLLLVEEAIGARGTSPSDLKVWVFDGVPRLLEVHHDRFTDHRSRLYTPGWEPVHEASGYPPGRDTAPPQHLEQMLRAAAVLARGFDFMRVDFYDEGGDLWFGELTPYPGSGMVAMGAMIDDQLGRWWRLPRRVTGGRRVVPDEGQAPGLSPARGSAAER